MWWSHQKLFQQPDPINTLQVEGEKEKRKMLLNNKTNHKLRYAEFHYIKSVWRSGVWVTKKG